MVRGGGVGSGRGRAVEAGQLVGGVATVPAWGVVGAPDAVAAVPGAQGRGGDPDPACGCRHLEPGSVGPGSGAGRDGARGRLVVRGPGDLLRLGGRGLRLHASSWGARTDRATRPDAAGAL